MTLTDTGVAKLDPRQLQEAKRILDIHASSPLGERSFSAMRMVYLAVIIALAAVAVIFALQNFTSVSVSFIGFSVTMPLAILVVVVYVLGAATGGSLFALLRRSYEGSRRSSRS
jgi:uncharacterized integral membrane protein